MFSGLLNVLPFYWPIGKASWGDNTFFLRSNYGPFSAVKVSLQVGMPDGFIGEIFIKATPLAEGVSFKDVSECIAVRECVANIIDTLVDDFPFVTFHRQSGEFG